MSTALPGREGYPEGTAFCAQGCGRPGTVSVTTGLYAGPDGAPVLDTELWCPPCAAKLPGRCGTCARALDNAEDMPASADCGGDCRHCLATIGDADEIANMGWASEDDDH